MALIVEASPTSLRLSSRVVLWSLELISTRVSSKLELLIREKQRSKNWTTKSSNWADWPQIVRSSSVKSKIIKNVWDTMGALMSQTLEYLTFWSSDFQLFGFGMVLTIPKPNHWESEQNAHFVRILKKDLIGYPSFWVVYSLKSKGRMNLFWQEQSSGILFHPTFGERERERERES